MANLGKGLLATFSDEHQLIEACRLMRERQFTKFDALTPFPVHGIDEAMGIKRSKIPYVTFLAGLTGGTFGLWLQCWTSAVDWPLNVGGKPFLSFPAFIPVVFELTILLGGLSTAAALFYFAGLPKVGYFSPNPAFTDDKFGLFIPADEKGYNADELSGVLKKCGAEDVRVMG